jgi:hypothetical protein
MASLKDMGGCIGLASSFSVLRDFYGYITGAPKPLSLLKQIRLVQGKHIHLNLILVGSESFTDADEAEIDAAVQATRDFYATVSLGVGRVLRFVVSTDQANGHDNIDSDSEAEDLTNEWTVHNDALDVFFVLTYATSTVGLSEVDGSCDKDGKGMTGSVVAIEGSANTTGFCLGHEVGHYLGLEHTDNSPGNLMFPTVPNGGNITSSQGSTMRSHCFVRSGC